MSSSSPPKPDTFAEIPWGFVYKFPDGRMAVKCPQCEGWWPVRSGPNQSGGESIYCARCYDGAVLQNQLAIVLGVAERVDALLQARVKWYTEWHADHYGEDDT